MTLKHFVSLIIGTLMVVTLSACDDDIQRPLTVGTNVWPGYEPGYLALELGYYSKERITLRQFQSATENIRAFRNAAVDVAALTMDEALLLIQDGFDIRIFLVADISHGGDVVLARPEYPSMRALKGKTIGVENSALGAYVLARALDIHGISITDVQTHAITVDQSEKAYDDGLVDAVVTFEPFRSHLLRKGAIEVFSSREMPNEIVDVLVTRAEHVEVFEDHLKILAEGWLKAAAFIKEEPHKASELLGRRLGLSPEEAMASFDGLLIPDKSMNRSLFAYDGPRGLNRSLQYLADFLTERRLLSKKINVDGILLDDYVKK